MVQGGGMIGKIDKMVFRAVVIKPENRRVKSVE